MNLKGLARLKSNLSILRRNIGLEPVDAKDWDWERTAIHIRDLLVDWGDRGRCRFAKCKAEIWWIQHCDGPDGRIGKKGPYQIDGINHFATCSGVKKKRKR